MPLRTTPLVVDNYYHIFNRGVEKRVVFMSSKDFIHFSETLIYYNQLTPDVRFSDIIDPAQKKPTSPKIVEIIAYCFMPNHFHLLLKQLEQNGISNLIRKAINSYTRFFNTKYERVGPLFQGPFKAVRIENDDQLVHLSRYIHLNPIVSDLVEDLREYKWSSYLDFVDSTTNDRCNPQEILNLFPSKNSYEQFVLDHVDYAKSLEEIKHLAIDA